MLTFGLHTNYEVTILVKQHRFWKTLNWNEMDLKGGGFDTYQYPHWQTGPVCEPHTGGLHLPPAFFPANRGQHLVLILSLTCAGLIYSYSAPHLCVTDFTFLVVCGSDSMYRVSARVQLPYGHNENMQ